MLVAGSATRVSTSLSSYSLAHSSGRISLLNERSVHYQGVRDAPDARVSTRELKGSNIERRLRRRGTLSQEGEEVPRPRRSVALEATTSSCQSRYSLEGYSGVMSGCHWCIHVHSLRQKLGGFRGQEMRARRTRVTRCKNPRDSTARWRSATRPFE